MTINQLHKLTGKLISEGAGRRAVCICKDTFKHPLENDGATILNISSASLKTFEMMDDDGYGKTLADGRTATSTALVFEGDAD